MALRQTDDMADRIAPTRLCQALAAALNVVDALDDRELTEDVEALLRPFGVPGWPLDVTAFRVAAWGLTTWQAAGAIDGIRQLGVPL